jgi:hypothetical protein
VADPWLPVLSLLHRMMCSAYDVDDRRHYTRNCSIVEKKDPNRAKSWSSGDLTEEYDGRCPYYHRCAACSGDLVLS